MKLSTIQTDTVRVVALMAGLSLAISARATVPISDLPDFDNLPNFAQLGNNIVVDGGTVNGNLGVSAGGDLSRTAPATINGDLYLAPGVANSGSGRVTTSIFTGQNLSVDQAAVFSASAGLSGLTPDTVYSSSQTGPFTFNVPVGEVYVVNFNNGLDLNSGSTITLTGGGSLVLNIAHSLSFSGATSGIFGDPANVFINYTGTSAMDMSLATVNGQFFMPDAAATMTGGILNGGVFSGNSLVTLDGLQTINAMPVPEPGVMVLISAGLASLLLARHRFGLKSSI